jgi:hypothetical protein
MLRPYLLNKRLGSLPVPVRTFMQTEEYLLLPSRGFPACCLYTNRVIQAVMYYKGLRKCYTTFSFKMGTECWERILLQNVIMYTHECEVAQHMKKSTN